MSPRRTILRELHRRHQEGEAGYTRPGTINGFEQKPADYQAAINALLQERLINGTKDGDGRLAIALNEHRLEAVHKELRPLYARPVTWVIALLLVGAVSAALLL